MLKYVQAPVTHRKYSTGSEHERNWSTKCSATNYKNGEFNSQPSSFTHSDIIEHTSKSRPHSASRIYPTKQLRPFSGTAIPIPSSVSPTSLDSSSSAYSSWGENEDSVSRRSSNTSGDARPCSPSTKDSNDNVFRKNETSNLQRSRRNLASSQRMTETKANDKIENSSELHVRTLASMFEKVHAQNSNDHDSITATSNNFRNVNNVCKLSNRFTSQVGTIPSERREPLSLSNSKEKKGKRNVGFEASPETIISDFEEDDDDLTYINIDELTSKSRLDRSLSKSMRAASSMFVNNKPRSEHFKRSALVQSIKWRNSRNLSNNHNNKQDAKFVHENLSISNCFKKSNSKIQSFVQVESLPTNNSDKSGKPSSILKTKSIIRSSIKNSIRKSKEKILPNGSELLISQLPDTNQCPQELPNSVANKDVELKKDDNNNRKIAVILNNDLKRSHDSSTDQARKTVFRRSRKRDLTNKDKNSARNSNFEKNSVPLRHKSASPARLRHSAGSPVHKRTCSLVSAMPDDEKKLPVRVWVKCLLQDMEYKTVHVTPDTTAQTLVYGLLSKFKMKHRDPNLYYLALEVVLVKNDGPTSTTVPLSDDCRPSALLECQPNSSSRLTLRMRRGGLLRVYDGELAQGSQYKSLLVSERSDCMQVISLVLACNNLRDAAPSDYVLVQVVNSTGSEMLLPSREKPLPIVLNWPSKDYAKLFIKLSKLQILPSLRNTPKLPPMKPPNNCDSKHTRSSSIPKAKDLTNSDDSCFVTSNSDRSIPDVISNSGEPNTKLSERKTETHSNSHKGSGADKINSVSQKTEGRRLPSPRSLIVRRQGRLLPKTPQDGSTGSTKTKYSTSINTSLLYHTYTNFEFLEKAGLTKSFSHGYSAQHASACESGEEATPSGSRKCEPPPSPPERAPRLPLRRKGVQSAGPDLLAGAEQNNTDGRVGSPATAKRRVLSYNDYENYFYI